MAKSCCIVGGTGGIGYELCRSFAKRGYKLYVTAPEMYQDELAKLEREYKAVTYVCDNADVDQIKEVIPLIEHDCGGVLDVLYCNGGMAIGGPVVCTDDVVMERMIRVNFIGHVYFVKYLISALFAAKGMIVFSTSLAGRAPLSWVGFYGGSKAALDVYARALYDELAPFGVNVYSVITGGVDTRIGQRNPEAKLQLGKSIKNSVYNVKGVYDSLQKSSHMTSAGEPPEVYAEGLVSILVSRPSGFNIYKGRSAVLFNFVGQWTPVWFSSWVMGRFFKSNAAYEQLRQHEREKKD